MKRVLKIILFSMFLIIPKIVNAECSNSDISRLQSLASNITYKYDYTEMFDDKSYGSVDFTIYLYNITDDMYVSYVPNYKSTGEVVEDGKINLSKSNNSSIVKNASTGKSHRFEVYASSNSQCSGSRLLTFYVAIPSYNKYYSSPLCEKAQGFKYCNKWSSVSISEEELIREVNKYLEKKEEPTKEEKKEKDSFKEWLYNLVTILNKYVYFIAIPVIVISAVLIIILRKKNDYNLKV